MLLCAGSVAKTVTPRCVCGLQATLAVLHQNVLPIVSAPGLNWVLTKICKAQIEAMLDDVKKEVTRVNEGIFCH